MQTAIEIARDWYEAEFPKLEQICIEVSANVKSLASKNGIDCDLNARPKSIASFVSKAHKKQYVDPRTETTDLAGVRAIVSSRSDRDKLASIIENSYDDAKLERKEPPLKGLDYSGIHITFPIRLVGQEEGDSYPCEIQVRTHGEDLWSRVSHELLYKPGLELPDSVSRPLYLLKALTEIFDREVENAMSTLIDNPLFPAAQLLSFANAEYFSRCAGGDVTETELSHEILHMIAPLIVDLENYQSTLHEFAQKHDAKLRQILPRHINDKVNVLLSQPECVVLFERLVSDQYSLTTACDGLPEGWLESLQDAWGTDI